MKHYTVFSKGSMCGLVVGILLATVYVWACIGLHPSLSPSGPSWLQLVFYPGLFVGYFLYGHGLQMVILCEIAGIAVMGAVGVILGWTSSVLIHSLTRKNHDA